MGIPHPATKGGPPTHLLLLVEYFRHHADFMIRTFYYGSRKYGIAYESVLMKFLVTTFTYLNFLRYLVVFRPHVVHLNTAFGSFSLLRDLPFAATAWLLRLKLLFKIHGSFDEIIHSKSWIIRLASKVFFAGAGIVGVLTETEKWEFQTEFKVRNKIHVVKNIVPSEPLVNHLRRYSFPLDSIYGLFVSRIDPRKGLSDLIEAMPGIVKEIPSFRLIVAGDGPSMKECRDLAERNGSNQYIFWLGWVYGASIAELFSAAKFFIFPTNYSEGMPMALIGAMQAGLPIITTRCRFVGDFLVEGRNYLAINKQDPVDIQRKVVQLLSDSEIQNRMRFENPEFAKKYTAESVGNEYVQLYDELMAGRSDE